MAKPSVTVEEWREENLPHFTACEERLKSHFTEEISRVADLLHLDSQLFRLDSRIKEAESAAKTAARRSMNYWKLPDWLGLRLSCPTLEAAYHLSLSANSLDDWQPGKRFDYNLEPKIEGYRGIHIYGKFALLEGNPVEVNCEIQLVTRLQALWSELTHDEIYKSEAHVSVLAQDTASNLAAYMAATDQLIERMLKIIKVPDEQMQVSESPETKYWIAVLSRLAPELDWYEIERLIDTLREMGIRKSVQLQLLRVHFPRLQPIIDREFKEVKRLTPSSFERIAVVARLIADRVNDAKGEERKIAQWAREGVQLEDEEDLK